MAEVIGFSVARILADESVDRVTVVLVGELDVSSADSARAVVDRAIEINRAELAFDMEGLTFMDSSGLALLVHAHNRAGVVVIRRPPEIVRRAIEITGLADLFEFEQ